MTSMLCTPVKGCPTDLDLAAAEGSSVVKSTVFRGLGAAATGEPCWTRVGRLCFDEPQTAPEPQIAAACSKTAARLLFQPPSRPALDAFFEAQELQVGERSMNARQRRRLAAF